MSESTPGGQQQGAARGANSSKGDSQETLSGVSSPSTSLPRNGASNTNIGAIGRNKNNTATGLFVNDLCEQFEETSASEKSGKQGPVAGNGQKGSQSVGRGASEIHDDLKTQTAMQRKTGSLGNIHDIQPKQMGVEECTVTTAESVVQLQHISHTFTERDDTIEVYLYLKEVDKDSLEVKFHPDTVHIKFQTRDAQFLKLCKGSTLKTKFSWTIRLKGQVQEDKCSFKVSFLTVSLKISKKVSGRWGDLENLKRTATKPENSADGEHENAHRRSESKRSVSAENSTKQPEMKTVDDKQGPKGSFDTDPTEPSESGSPYTSQNQKQETPNEEDGDTNDKKPDIHQKTSDVRETNTKKENTVQTTPTSQQQSGSDGRHGFPSTNSGTTGGPTDQPVTGTDTEPSQIATTTSGRRMPPPTPEDGDSSGATQETLSRGHSNSQAKDPAEMHTDSQPNKHNLDGRKGEPASAAIGILAEGPKPKEDDDKKDHDVKKQIAEAMEDSESGTDNSREGSRDRSSPTPLRGSQRPDVASRIETSLSTQSHNTRDPLKANQIKETLTADQLSAQQGIKPRTEDSTDVGSGPGQPQDDMSTSLKGFDAKSMKKAAGVCETNEGKEEKSLSYGDYELKNIAKQWTLKNKKTGRSSLIKQKDAYFEEEYLVLDGEIFEIRDNEGPPKVWRLDGADVNEHEDERQTNKTDQDDLKEECKEKTDSHEKFPLLTQSAGKHEKIFIKCKCFIDDESFENDVQTSIEHYVKWLFIACENENVGQSEVKELHHLAVMRLDVNGEELLIYLQKGFDKNHGFKEVVNQTLKTILNASSHVEVEKICAKGIEIDMLFKRLHDEEKKKNYVAFYEEESSSLFIACSSNTKTLIIGHLNSALTVCYRHEFTKPMCIANMVNHGDFQSVLRKTQPTLNVSVKTDGFTATIKACGSRESLKWLDEQLGFNEVKFTDINHSDHVKLPDVLPIFMKKTSSKNPSIFWDIYTRKGTVVVCSLHSQEVVDKIVHEIKNCLEQVKNTFDKKMKDFVEMHLKTKPGVLNMVFTQSQTEGEVLDLHLFCLKEDKVSLEEELKDIFREFRSSSSSKKCKIENTESVVEPEANVSGAVKTPGSRNVAFWNNDSGNTISVIELAAEDCDEDVIVYLEESDEIFESKFLTKGQNQLCTTIPIPKWRGGSDKEKHFVEERMLFVLKEIQKRKYFKIGVVVQPCKTWNPVYRYVKSIVRCITQFLGANTDPFCFSFCAANEAGYKDCKEILEEGIPKVFVPSDLSDPSDDNADDNDALAAREKDARHIGQAAKNEHPAGAIPKTYYKGKETPPAVPSRSPLKAGSGERQRKLKDHKQDHWDNSMLERGAEETFIIVQNIKKGTTEEELKKRLKDTAHSQLIYCFGKNEAILVFETPKDADRALQNIQQGDLSFSKHPPLPLPSCNIILTPQELKAIKPEERHGMFATKFCPPYYTFGNEPDGSIKITSKSMYGIECVMSFVADFDCKTEKIAAVSEMKWTILCQEKDDLLKQIEERKGKIEYKDGYMTLECPKISFDNFQSELKKYVEDLNQYEGERDLLISKKKLEDAKHLCKDLQGCFYTFINEGEEVRLCILMRNYEESINKVKHLFAQIKTSSEIKPTGRHRRQRGTAAAGQDSATKVETNEMKHTSDKQEFLIGDGMSVFVYKGDICKLSVDAIVNAANSKLRHAGGVAYAIANSAGFKLQRESDEIIRLKGEVPVGSAVLTTAGNLKNRSVIHTVGPRWSDYDTSTVEGVSECTGLLCKAIMSCFEEADKEGLKSVALPAVSSAIFGVPIELCTVQYANAVIRYCASGKSHLKEIHFIDQNEAVVKTIQSTFKVMLEDNSNAPYVEADFVTRSRNKAMVSRRNTSTRQTEGQTYDVLNSTKQLKLDLVNDDNKRLEIRNQVISLRCYVGDLSNEASNAIAVCIDHQGNAGNILQKILKQWGRTSNSILQCKLKARKYVETGDVIATDGKGTCLKLFHIVLPLSIKKEKLDFRKVVLQKAYTRMFETFFEDPDLKTLSLAIFGLATESKEEVEHGTAWLFESLMAFSLDQMSKPNDGLKQINIVCKENEWFKWTKDKIVQGFTSLSGDKAEVEPSTFVKGSEQNTDSNDDCVICMDTMDNPRKLDCGHAFCTGCIEQHFAVKKTCPTCGRVCGVIKGDQPPGTMTVEIDRFSSCAGFPYLNQIVIRYNFNGGKQGSDHPSPGERYDGITRTAYLPDNDEGKDVCRMLKLAFKRNLVFTIGRSRTTGKEGVITWNDIHHKTDKRHNAQFGYPDPSYLSRVQDELKAKGITCEDIDKKEKLTGTFYSW